MSSDQGNNGVTVTFDGTTLTNFESYSGPAMESEFYEVTYIGDVWGRKNPTTRKVGPINCVVGYDPAAHSSLFTAFVAGTIGTVVVNFAGGNGVGSSSFSYNGFISKCELAGGDSKSQAKLNLSIEHSSGAVTQA